MHFLKPLRWHVLAIWRKNTDRKLDTLIGSRSATLRSIHNALFGSDGLTSCSDSIVFNARVQKARSTELAAGLPAFAYYSENNIHHSLRDNIVAGRPGWTNNNCESLNHVIKQYTQYRPRQFTDLIAKLHDLVSGQYTEADRALCRRGDLILQPAYAKHRLTVDAWRVMSLEQRQKYSNACFRQSLQIPASN